MKVFLASITAEKGNIWGPKVVDDFLKLAQQDRYQIHEIVKNPEEADIIIA